jgi:preprotein translocase subunit Sss1
MTPDTTAYMIAGFSVILIGVIGYMLSLVVRNWMINHRQRK